MFSRSLQRKSAVVVTVFACTIFGGVSIIENSAGSITLSVTMDSVIFDTNIQDNTPLLVAKAEGFGVEAIPGEPMVPFAVRKIAMQRYSTPKITILSVVADTMHDVLFFPALEYPRTERQGTPQAPRFFFGKSYTTPGWKRTCPVYVAETQTLGNISLATIMIEPILTNAMARKGVWYRSFTAKIEFQPVRASASPILPSHRMDIIANSVVNGDVFRNTASSGLRYADSKAPDILILTTTSFAAAAESLAVWQRMKGFNVVVNAQASWTSKTAKSAVSTFYTSTNPKPGYLCIMGDAQDVPPDSTPVALDATLFPTDLYYACFSGAGDYVPEMARGRISADNPDQMMKIVRKIINYELNPPTDASFYTSALAAGYFQDIHPDGYEDLRFIKCCEDIRNYLMPKGISSTRVYYTEFLMTSPQYWNKDMYSYGESIPDDLKMPAFAWKGNSTDINNAINKGCFFVYHYDHGMEEGWGNPTWTISNLAGLNNGVKLPVVLSIDCLVGTYNWVDPQSIDDDCFAEEALAKEIGGIVGMVAASTKSLTGSNDALMFGIVDAIWPSPGLPLKMPMNGGNPTILPHSAMYAMGDALDQGLLQISGTLPPQNAYAQIHSQMYHWFGDPCMRVWTKKPTALLPVVGSSLGTLDTKFPVTGLGQLEEGTVSLVNISTGALIGSSGVNTDGSATITIDQSVFAGDKLIFTATAVDRVPFQKEITVVQGTVSTDVPLTPNAGVRVYFSNQTLHVSVLKPGTWSVCVRTINGRILLKKTLRFNTGDNGFSLHRDLLPPGVVITEVTAENVFMSVRILVL